MFVDEHQNFSTRLKRKTSGKGNTDERDFSVNRWFRFCDMIDCGSLFFLPIISDSFLSHHKAADCQSGDRGGAFDDRMRRTLDPFLFGWNHAGRQDETAAAMATHASSGTMNGPQLGSIWN